MPVYFLQCEVTKLIRIGCSQTLFGARSRIRSHSYEASTPLTILGVLLDLDKDRPIHDRFSHLYHHAEWFNPSEELLDFIKDNTVALPELSKVGARCQAVNKSTGEPCKFTAAENNLCRIHLSARDLILTNQPMEKTGNLPR